MVQCPAELTIDTTLEGEFITKTIKVDGRAAEKLRLHGTIEGVARSGPRVRLRPRSRESVFLDYGGGM